MECRDRRTARSQAVGRASGRGRATLDRPGRDPPPRPSHAGRLEPLRVPSERPEEIARIGVVAGEDIWTRELIIDKVREYARVLGARRGTQRDYRQYIDKHPDCGRPSTSTITRHGLRFQEALAEARDSVNSRRAPKLPSLKPLLGSFGTV